MKKKLFLMLMIGSVIGASSCKKLKDAADQDITVTPNSIEMSIGAIGTTSSVSTIGEENVSFDLNALIKEKESSFGISNVKSVKLNSIKAEIVGNTADDNNNFGNLESISAEISATGKTSQVMASLSNNPSAYATSVTIPANGNIELKEFITGTGIKYKLTGKLRKATTKTLRVKVTASYQLVVGL